MKKPKKEKTENLMTWLNVEDGNQEMNNHKMMKPYLKARPRVKLEKKNPQPLKKKEEKEVREEEAKEKEEDTMEEEEKIMEEEVKIPSKVKNNLNNQTKLNNLSQIFSNKNNPYSTLKESKLMKTEIKKFQLKKKKIVTHHPVIPQVNLHQKKKKKRAKMFRENMQEDSTRDTDISRASSTKKEVKLIKKFLLLNIHNIGFCGPIFIFLMAGFVVLICKKCRKVSRRRQER
jgi:hypothetical protein